MGGFWQHLTKLRGTPTRMPTAFHPQTDGGLKAKSVVECYPRTFAAANVRHCDRLLAMAEFSYNSQYIRAGQLTVWGEHCSSVSAALIAFSWRECFRAKYPGLPNSQRRRGRARSGRPLPAGAPASKKHTGPSGQAMNEANCAADGERDGTADFEIK